MKPVCIIQNCALESAGHLADYLKEKSIPYNVVRNHDGETLPDVADLEAAVVLGTPISVLGYQQHDYLKRLFAFMAAAARRDLPLLSICGGGQLLARVLGADVVKSPVREIGLYTVTLTDEAVKDRLFGGLPGEIEVFQWHADAFQIPFGATLLATGETCRNQAFRKGNAVAVLFHIEPRADEVPLWCDEYVAELEEEGLTKQAIVTAYNMKENQMRQLSYGLMQNFLG